MTAIPIKEEITMSTKNQNEKQNEKMNEKQNQSKNCR